MSESFAGCPSGSGACYDGANIIEDLNANGTVKQKYTYGPNVDEVLAMGSQSLISDRLGTVTLCFASYGRAPSYDTYFYTPSGNPGPGYPTASCSYSRYRFTGREYDQSTGLYYYRARYYDPQHGRFISEDPIGFEDNTNFYSYVENNPTNSLDPLGLVRWEYDVKFHKQWWGESGSTRPDYPPLVKLKCECDGNGHFKLGITVSFRVNIWYAPHQLQHEQGHLQIMKDFFGSRSQKYETYERTYATQADCWTAARRFQSLGDNAPFMRTLQMDSRTLGQKQREHDDFLQNFWFSIVKIITGG